MADEVILFLKDLMRRRHRNMNQLSADLGVSHATVGRWLSGKDVPSISSCRKLAEYSGVPILRIFNIVSQEPRTLAEENPDEWPEFREYAQRKYAEELDEDIIDLIEGLIERRRTQRLQNTLVQAAHTD